MHQAINLLRHKPVCKSVQMPQRRPTVHWVLLLCLVQEQGPADAVPHHDKGPTRALPVWRRSACNQPASFTPACPISGIFVLTGDICGRGRRRGCAGWSGRMQDPERRQGWGGRSRREKQVRRRGYVQQGGVRKEVDSGDDEKVGTGEQETKQEGGNTGKQQQSRGEVPRGWDRPVGERRRNRRVKWIEDGGIGGTGGG